MKNGHVAMEEVVGAWTFQVVTTRSHGDDIDWIPDPDPAPFLNHVDTHFFDATWMRYQLYHCLL